MLQRLDRDLIDDLLFDIRQLNVVHDDYIVRLVFAFQTIHAKFKQPIKRVLNRMLIVVRRMMMIVIVMTAIVVTTPTVAVTHRHVRRTYVLDTLVAVCRVLLKNLLHLLLSIRRAAQNYSSYPWNSLWHFIIYHN